MDGNKVYCPVIKDRCGALQVGDDGHIYCEITGAKITKGDACPDDPEDEDNLFS